VDGVDEQHRVDRVEGPGLPLGELVEDLVGDPRDGVPGDGGTVDLGEVRRDLPGGQPPGGQRQDDLVDPVQAALTLAHDHRLEAGVAVSRDFDLHRADLGEHVFDRVPCGNCRCGHRPGRACHAQVLAPLRFQGGLEHGLGQPSEQPARSDELHPLRPGAVDELLGELLLINLSWHGLDRVGHGWSFPRDTPGVLGPVTPTCSLQAGGSWSAAMVFQAAVGIARVTPAAHPGAGSLTACARLWSPKGREWLKRGLLR
jgi:hypothetical protein